MSNIWFCVWSSSWWNKKVQKMVTTGLGFGRGGNKKWISNQIWRENKKERKIEIKKKRKKKEKRQKEFLHLTHNHFKNIINIKKVTSLIVNILFYPLQFVITFLVMLLLLFLLMIAQLSKISGISGRHAII